MKIVRRKPTIDEIRADAGFRKEGSFYRLNKYSGEGVEYSICVVFLHRDHGRTIKVLRRLNKAEEEYLLRHVLAYEAFVGHDVDVQLQPTLPEKEIAEEVVEDERCHECGRMTEWALSTSAITPHLPHCRSCTNLVEAWYDDYFHGRK